jgi:hypothetical protein
MEPFFQRFSKKDLLQHLHGAVPELYKKHDIILLANRVGIVCSGSVRLFLQQSDTKSPTNLGKFSQGKILGHASDNGITNQSMLWIVCYENNTELLFIEKDKFQNLWDIQKKNLVN